MSIHRLKLSPRNGIEKCPSGIIGLDQITGGGMPKGRPTLLCGTAGCGKTVLATEFLVRGAAEFNEPGVFMAFEETDKELTENVASMGFDLHALCARKKLFLDYVRVERSEIEETGEYDLEAPDHRGFVEPRECAFWTGFETQGVGTACEARKAKPNGSCAFS